jgi:hypothetical protein
MPNIVSAPTNVTTIIVTEAMGCSHEALTPLVDIPLVMLHYISN